LLARLTAEWIVLVAFTGVHAGTVVVVVDGASVLVVVLDASDIFVAL
jgi:hypothetical protein